MASEVKIVGNNNTPAKITQKGEQVVTLYNGGEENSSSNPLITGIASSIFTFSTGNTSSVQLASGATFPGVIDDIVGYPAISLLMTSDQNMLVTVIQYIDSAGTLLASSTPFTVYANTGFARSFPINGNYLKVTARNLGASTTTTFRLDTAYGVIDSSNSSGNIPVEQATQYAQSTITTQNLVANGTATTNSAVEIGLNGASQIAIQVTGTYTGALSLQVTSDNSRWETITASSIVNFITGAYAATITSASIGVFIAEVGSFLKARITGLAAVTGTATITLRASAISLPSTTRSIPTGSNVIGAVTQSGTFTVMPGNTANTTPWLIKQELGTSSLSTSTSLNSAGSTNATSLKNTAGMVGFISLNNASITAKYFRLFNKASAPTVGTDIPFMVITIPASSSKEIEYTNGIEFTTGIAYAITGGATATDSTAVTAGDVQLNITWQ